MRSRQVQVGGTRLHAIEAGRGPCVVLVPGWPQTAYAWRHVVPALVATDRRVAVVEPRGLGHSGKPPVGYDLDTAAADLATTIEALSPGALVDLVGHDVGAWIVHAHHERFSAQVRSLTMVDAALPGVTRHVGGVPSDEANSRTWHFGFNRLRELPELLIAGRERAFLEWLFVSKSRRASAFDAQALDEYAAALAAPGALTAGLAYYRELFSAPGLARAAQRASLRIACPVLTVGAEGGVGNLLGETLAPLAEDLTTRVLGDCGHYVPEECPEELVAELLSFWSASG